MALLPAILTFGRRHKLRAPVVVHCFTGNQEELKEVVGEGFYVGITGWVCDDRPERSGEALAVGLGHGYVNEALGCDVRARMFVCVCVCARVHARALSRVVSDCENRHIGLNSLRS
jgi:hypothetical protein